MKRGIGSLELETLTVLKAANVPLTFTGVSVAGVALSNNRVKLSASVVEVGAEVTSQVTTATPLVTGIEENPLAPLTRVPPLPFASAPDTNWARPLSLATEADNCTPAGNPV